MACVSWVPGSVAATLGAERSAQPVLLWLATLRASIEEYDALITVQEPEPEPDCSSDSTQDSAFDEILSQLGKEIYQLDVYQRNLAPEQQDVSLSILNIFDECLDTMTKTEPVTDTVEMTELVEVTDDIQVIRDDEVISDEVKISDKCNEVFAPVQTVTLRKAPIPAPRTKRKTTSTSSYEIMEVNPDYRRLESVSDSDSERESTCWSYQECSNNKEVNKVYSSVWSHSSGFHNSDKILRSVLSQNQATMSRVSFYTAEELPLARYDVYALAEPAAHLSPPPVVAMTPDRPDDYVKPRDALDENIYEEIDFTFNYTDEGCSCEGSIEVETCSISASSEGVGESPLYANLRDYDAYAISADVIFWKNLLLDPYYNEDEEDEWITPEECGVYSRDQQPPYVIPRITPAACRPPRQRAPPSYTEDDENSSRKSSFQQERLHEWSPSSERARDEHYRTNNSDSPPFGRNIRFGSSENLVQNLRRPTHLQLPASSSGDSLDIEVRDWDRGYSRNRKSKSMMAPPKRSGRVRSPVPAPRLIVHQNEGATVLLEGVVKRTKFSEGGKKCKKNWTECYMILTPTALVFYKDFRTYHATKTPKAPGTPPSPTAPRAEIVLALRNAHTSPCIQNHTRRYTKSLVLTVDYDQYLLQDATEDGIKRWLHCIQNVIYRLGPPKPEDYNIHYQSSNTDLESLGRTPPVSRNNRSKQKAGGSSNEDLSDSTEVSIQKQDVKSRLRKFFAKRPSMDVLVKKGIYKDEPVFGRKLEEVCPAVSPRVPDFVVACVREIESSEENMCTDGLYRASGNLSQVQKIRLEIDQNHLQVIENSPDIHVLTGSLKLFFRELKEPLIPYNLFDRVLAACSIKPREAKIKEFREIVQALPPCNRDTLKFLLEHLLRVTKYSERNRMHTANLAIVFGPTLLLAPVGQSHNMAIDYIQQNNVVDFLLNDFSEIFVEDTKGKKKA